jgi:hypothetical protein
MPQRTGGESYAERFRREKLGRTVNEPVDGPTRSGADALPGRSLGGLPPLWHLFHATPGTRRVLGPTYWEDQAYRNARLAEQMWAQQQPPQTGYGGTTPGSVPIGTESEGRLALPVGPVQKPGYERIPYPLTAAQYAGGGSGVVANDILGQFGPVVTGAPLAPAPGDPVIALLRQFLTRR